LSSRNMTTRPAMHTMTARRVSVCLSMGIIVVDIKTVLIFKFPKLQLLEVHVLTLLIGGPGWGFDDFFERPGFRVVREHEGDGQEHNSGPHYYYYLVRIK
jgi:hypothetical protein